jgi:aminoglycoside phosphotransferase (APT) family kinase protein
VSDFAELHEAVAREIRATVPGGVLGELRVLEGGRSGVTLTATVAGGGEGLDAVVVKAAPPGRPPVGRHDVLRQARVMSAVAGLAGFVVPEVLATGTEPVHFLVMTRAAGEAVEPVLDAATVHLPADLVRDQATVAARMLARLHADGPVPPPPGERAEPVADLVAELARWQATAEAADPDLLPGGQRLATLLEKSRPRDPVQPVLIHGDFRLGNIVFDGPTPTGVIDWEIWGHSDPGVDLGWFLVFCDPALFPGIGAPVDGMPSADELMAAYRAAGGRPVEQLPWYEAFGRFKMAAIMAHNLKRHRTGRHVDPFQERLPPTITRLIESGIERLDA